MRLTEGPRERNIWQTIPNLLLSLSLEETTKGKENLSTQLFMEFACGEHFLVRRMFFANMIVVYTLHYLGRYNRYLLRMNKRRGTIGNDKKGMGFVRYAGAAAGGRMGAVRV